MDLTRRHSRCLARQGLGDGILDRGLLQVIMRRARDCETTVSSEQAMIGKIDYKQSLCNTEARQGCSGFIWLYSYQEDTLHATSWRGMIPFTSEASSFDSYA